MGSCSSTVPYYGNGLAEERLRRGLKGIRDEVVVAAKAGRYGFDDFDFSRGGSAQASRSLRLLQTDWVDIFLVHDVEFVDLDIIVNESYPELVRIRDEGLCRSIGMSGIPAPRSNA